MNIATISGNLTKDIEISSTKTGKHVTRFCLGVRRDKEATDFINCEAWGTVADLLEKYCSKGSKIGVSGKIRNESYEKDGKKVYKTYILVSDVDFYSASKAADNTSTITNNINDNITNSNEQAEIDFNYPKRQSSSNSLTREELDVMNAEFSEINYGEDLPF